MDKLDHATATAARAGPMCRLKVAACGLSFVCVDIEN